MPSPTHRSRWTLLIGAAVIGCAGQLEDPERFEVELRDPPVTPPLGVVDAAGVPVPDASTGSPSTGSDAGSALEPDDAGTE